MDDLSQVRWQRASNCDSGSCVEVACVDDRYAIRDSKDPDGPTLTFSPAEWRTFANGIRAGDFDTPV
jgi:hypothetical protein